MKIYLIDLLLLIWQFTMKKFTSARVNDGSNYDSLLPLIVSFIFKISLHAFSLHRNKTIVSYTHVAVYSALDTLWYRKHKLDKSLLPRPKMKKNVRRNICILIYKQLEVARFKELNEKHRCSITRLNYLWLKTSYRRIKTNSVASLITTSKKVDVSNLFFENLFGN